MKGSPDLEQKVTEFRAQPEVRPSHGFVTRTGAFQAMVEAGVHVLTRGSEEDKKTFKQAGEEVIVYFKKHPLG